MAAGSERTPAGGSLLGHEYSTMQHERGPAMAPAGQSGNGPLQAFDSAAAAFSSMLARDAGTGARVLKQMRAVS